jgi:glycosyltransferase involved in cell wall biosynthesis
MHGRLDLPDLPPVLREFAMMPLVSISTAQRAPMPWANWYGTVYHGMPRSLYAAGSGDGGYLAFIGRICPEKRPDWAIEIARRAGLPLTIAAKVDKADRTYYRTRIKPLLKDPLVEFVGEIGDSDKEAFLGDAMALLFPIDWPEPFGLVLIEATSLQSTSLIAPQYRPPYTRPPLSRRRRGGTLVSARVDVRVGFGTARALADLTGAPRSLR